MIRDRISAINYCAIVHLTLFFVVANLMIGRESMLQILEYVIDAFEILFSPLLFGNADALIDLTTKATAMKVFTIFILTAVPVYAIGYPVFSRLHKSET